MSPDPLIIPVLDHIEAIRNTIPHWESSARLYGAISWGVFLLGLAVSGFQLLKRDWTKSAVAVIGLLVAGLTGTLERGFPCDRRAYLAGILEAQNTIRNLENAVANFNGDPELGDRSGNPPSVVFKAKLDFLNKNVQPLDSKLTEIQTKLLAAEAPTVVEPVVYATAMQEQSAGGVGECNLTWQSRENSNAAAVEKMVALLAKSAGITPGVEERELLRKYVATYSTKTEGPDLGAQMAQSAVRQTSNGLTRYLTTLTLGPIYANPYAIKSYVQSERDHSGRRQSREELISSIRQRITKGQPSEDVDGFLEAKITLPAAGGAVSLGGKDPNKGSFVLHFTVTGTGAAATVSLTSVEVRSDASIGSTRWSFDVLQQDHLVFGVPTQRWDDSKKPTVCTIDPGAGFSGSAQMSNGTVDVTVVGLKPKVL